MREKEIHARPIQHTTRTHDPRCPVSPSVHRPDGSRSHGRANDPDPGNPIAVEVARLIEGYTENFRAHVERLGYIPDSFLHVKPQTPIEALAMRLTTEAIQQAATGDDA
jgi:hypothetical protein